MRSNLLIENVYAPLPFGFHLGFCILATIVYGISFARKKQKRYFYLLLAIDVTLLTQLGDNVYSILVIVIAEIVLLLMAIVDYVKFKVEQKSLEQAKAAMANAQTQEDVAEEIQEAAETIFDETSENE